jgi:hypothetical protein
MKLWLLTKNRLKTRRFERIVVNLWLILRKMAEITFGLSNVEIINQMPSDFITIDLIAPTSTAPFCRPKPQRNPAVM